MLDIVKELVPLLPSLLNSLSGFMSDRETDDTKLDTLLSEISKVQDGLTMLREALAAQHCQKEN